VWKAGWTPPFELQRGSPRPVRFTGRGYLAVIGVSVLIAVSLAAGIALYVMRQRALKRASLLAAEGIAAPARVVSTGIDNSEDRNRFVAYEFATGGQSYRGRTTLNGRDKRPFFDGSAVTVHYLPGNPEQSWLEDYKPEGPPGWVPFGMPLGPVIGAVSLMLALRRQRRLLADGVAAQGRIVSFRRRHTDHSSGYRVECEFQLKYGATERAKVRSMRRPPAPGTAVTMLYDEYAPKRAAIYPCSMVRVERGFGN
jgi:hypothetical protein